MTAPAVALVVIGAATVTSWLFRIVDAIAAAQRYKGREEYAAVYDRQTKTAVVVFGDPFTPVFCEYVTIKRRPHK